MSEMLAGEQVAEVADTAVATSDEAAVAADWKAALPDDLREHPSIAGMQDVASLAKSMVHAQSMVGADKIAVPGKWADDEDWSQVYDKLGRPASAEDYGLQFEVPDGEADPALTGWFAETAHKIGLNTKQAQQLADSYIELTGGMGQPEVDLEAAKAEATSELRQEYGAAFDDRLGKGNNFLGEFGADGLMELRLQDGTPLMNHPAFIRTVVNAAQYIHESVSEDKLIGDKDSNVVTPGEAQKQLEEVMREDSPYWDARHPQHDVYVQRALSIQEMIHPDLDDE
tara:strand:- start:6 stop:857 length:852 start_codon:yes stop_codon:yes gene_type:complete